ncbi:peptidoglycan DD-metalloendopeptidase family protein [Streptomyces sp. NPDC058000]|uniref:peptidoglycan DD-metalloendopeptidase family protein n=1 Tax=Streptomyces sp. NPDC058000 TaxID=3346299 RepID=UPI0036F1155F
MTDRRPHQGAFSHDLLVPEPLPQGAPSPGVPVQGAPVAGSLPGGEPALGLESEGADGEGADEEGFPVDESGVGDGAARLVRGKHRVAKQRGGGLARGGTVLGVGVIAAVGASGVAAAEGRPPVPISMPDPGGLVDDAAGAHQDAAPRPGASPLAAGGGVAHAPTAATSAVAAPSSPSAPLSQAIAPGDGAQGAAEALRNRILQQADGRPGAAEHAAVLQAAHDTGAQQGAAERAATGEEKPAAAPETTTATQPTVETAAETAAEPAAESEAETAAEPQAGAEAAPRTAPEARPAPQADRPTDAAKPFAAPVSSYTLAAGFGQTGDRWAADHTGQDFTAPTGTLVTAVHDGTITQAGWAGGYGYRIVLTLDDGTELWFCHLSSMVKTTGRVHTGDVIGRVGATGNATAPHLHLEVRPGAGAPTDPLPWLHGHGATV